MAQTLFTGNCQVETIFSNVIISVQSKTFLLFLRKRLSGKNRKHRSVFGQIQHTKSLPAKQAITVGSSSNFNVRLLHD